MVLLASEESAEKIGARPAEQNWSCYPPLTGPVVRFKRRIQFNGHQTTITSACLLAPDQTNRQPTQSCGNLKLHMNRRSTLHRSVVLAFVITVICKYWNKLCKKVPAPVLQTYSERAHLCCPSSELFKLGSLVHCSAHGLALE